MLSKLNVGPNATSVPRRSQGAPQFVALMTVRPRDIIFIGKLSSSTTAHCYLRREKPKMPVQVLPAQDADMTRIFEIASRAFAETKDPIWPVLWPEGSDVKAGGDRMRKTKNSDPNTTYVKAVDDVTGEILGMAKWNIWTKENIALSDKAEGLVGEYSTDEDRAFANTLIPKFVADRNEAKLRTSGNLVSLDILTVDPAHQRKKVGDALVRWGAQRADELGFEAVVESSTFGRGLYEKHGYVWIKDVVVEAPEFPERQKGSYAWLVRPGARTDQ